MIAEERAAGELAAVIRSALSIRIDGQVDADGTIVLRIPLLSDAREVVELLEEAAEVRERGSFWMDECC